ncbi:MAG: DUF488 domain-containing protein [Moheibacter sp.]
MMETQNQHTIYTIGHSTRSLEEFIDLLHSFEIKNLADIRSLPGSRKFPWFDSELLEVSLKNAGIEYRLIKKLGGRRKSHRDSKNTRWHKVAFRSYADYMESAEFGEGICELLEFAKSGRTAYMCAEAVWWRCHRSMVSDYLKAKGWTVLHIMSLKKAEEHPFTQPAIVKGYRVFYCDLPDDK